jgi:hypothetical protein
MRASSGSGRKLFSYYIESKCIIYLFMVLTILFSTWFFLAGVPQNFIILKQEVPYLKGIKVFTQLLLPLFVPFSSTAVGKAMVSSSEPVLNDRTSTTRTSHYSFSPA